mgnify:CR=1 FL=1
MKLEQASDIARLQDANIYALKNTASQSDMKRFMELRNANETLAELQAMYYDLEQFKYRLRKQQSNKFERSI